MPLLQHQAIDLEYLKRRDKDLFNESFSNVSYLVFDDAVVNIDSLIGSISNRTWKTAVNIRAWLTFEETGEKLDQNQRIASNYELRALFTRKLLEEASITIKIQDRFTYQGVDYEVVDTKEIDLIGTTGIYLRTQAFCKRYKGISNATVSDGSEIL